MAAYKQHTVWELEPLALRSISIEDLTFHSSASWTPIVQHLISFSLCSGMMAEEALQMPTII